MKLGFPKIDSEKAAKANAKERRKMKRGSVKSRKRGR